jgi:lysophospholipase L1-like esterase
MTKGRLRWFKLIAVALPLIVLLLAEGILRLAGYGHSTALFVRDPDDTAYYIMNPYASAPYFSDDVNATKGNLERFPVRKKPGTLRIFVLGESTTAGYPYFHNGSFHRWLYYRLLHSYPDTNFEVINVSLTAVNSYTVLGFGRQVADYAPDAVLIYTGHNEYYGALGVGSTSHTALIGITLWLRQFRVVQALQHLVGKFRHVDIRENLLQRMAAEQTIPFRSPDYDAGIRQFARNMDALCGFLSRARIPVFLSTLVGNQRDQAPFISGPAPFAADSAFAAGNAAFAAGRFDRAAQAYRDASDWDLLRFRAPDTLNIVIRRLCATYGTYVHLVDARALFEAHSPGGIPGRETLLEHVHPNLYGYALLSDAFYQALCAAHFLAPGKGMSFDTLLERMPVTRVDSLNGAYQIMMLKTRWPFHDTLAAGFVRGNSPDEVLAGALSVGHIGWLDAMDQVFQRSLREGDKRGALRAAEAVLLEHPDNKTYLAFCGRLSFECGYWPATDLYFQKLYDLEGSLSNAQSLLLAYVRTDRPDKALALIAQRAELRNPSLEAFLRARIGKRGDR